MSDEKGMIFRYETILLSSKDAKTPPDWAADSMGSSLSHSGGVG